MTTTSYIRYTVKTCVYVSIIAVLGKTEGHRDHPVNVAPCRMQAAWTLKEDINMGRDRAELPEILARA